MASNYSLAVTETGDRVVVNVQADDDLQEAAHVSINEIEIQYCRVSVREIEE